MALISDKSKSTTQEYVDKYGLKKAAALSAGLSQGSIAAQIETLPEYEISQEAKDRLALLEESAAGLEESAAEQTSVAKSRAGMFMAPGTAQTSQDIERATASQVGALQQMGGSGFLSNITKVGQTEEQAYENLIRNNMAYKEQSEQALMNAMSTEAGMKMQAAGLRSQGLEGMIQEKDKVFQSKLNKAQTGIQAELTMYSTEQMKKAVEANKPKILGLF